MAELPDKRQDPPPRLFPVVTELFANGATVGAVYFGGMRLSKKYGISKTTFQDLKGEVDDFLVKKGVMRPRPLSRPETSAGSGLDTAERTALGGPRPPRTPIPGSIFGIDRTGLAPAHLARQHQVIVDAIAEYRALLAHEDPATRLLARDAIVHVLQDKQQHLFDPSVSRFSQVDVRKIAMGDSQEMTKFWDLLKPATVSADPELETAQFAKRLLEMKRRLIDRQPGLPVEVDEIDRSLFDQVDAALEATGSAASKSALLNARGVEVQKHLWHHSRLHGELTASKITDLETVLDPYDVKLSLGPALFHTIPNKRGLRKIMTTLATTQGVSDVSLVSLEAATAQHHVAVIRIRGKMMGDPTKEFSKLLHIPLLGEYNTFVPGLGQNILAGTFYVPEQVSGPDVPGEAVSLRLGGTRAEDFLTSIDDLAHRMEAHAESFVRELAEGNEQRAHRFWRTHMLEPAYLEHGQLLLGQNLYGHFYGGRVRFGAQETLRNPEALRLRMEGMQQFALLRQAKDTGRPIMYLDIETVSPTPEAHPIRKMLSAETEIYQISALLKTPDGKVLGSKMWWVHSPTEVSPQWAQHAAGPGEDWRVHKAWLEKNIRQGVPIEQALREVKDFALSASGELPVVAMQYGVDVGTIEQIAGKMDQDLARVFREIWDPRHIVDTWKMTHGGNRALNQSFELGHLARMFGIKTGDIEEAFKQHVSHLQIRGGANKTIGEDLFHYMRQHSSMMDDFIASFVIEKGLLGDNFVTRTLGNTAEQDLFAAALAPGFDPALTPAMLNMAEYYKRAGIAWDDSLFRLLFPGGHPTSMMARGVMNVMDILSVYPFANWGAAYRRGAHKRINTAQLTDASARYLATMDPHRGLAPGSTLHPHFMTEQTLALMKDPTAAAEYLGHFYNARIAYANTPYATQSNVLMTAQHSAGLQTTFRQYNFPIPIPNPGTGHTVIRARVVGVDRKPVNPDLVTPGQFKEHALPFKVWNGQWMIIEYETDKGIAYTSELYTGHDPFTIIESELVGNTLYVGRQITRDVVMGSRASLLGENVTVTPSRDAWYRGSASNAEATLDYIANLSEGYTKYWEHGKSAQLIFGKVFDPVLEAVRRGGPAAIAARSTLERLTGLLGLGAASVVEVVNPHARQRGVRTPAPMATVVLSTQSQARYDELMRQGLTWQNITEMYRAVNELGARHPATIPSFMKYGQGETQELIDTQRELETWKQAMEQELAQTRQRLGAEKDITALQTLRTQEQALERDLGGLEGFRRELGPGKLKYHEYIRKHNPMGPPLEFLGLTTVGPVSIGAKSPFEGADIVPIETVQKNALTGGLERVGGPPRTFAGNPSGGLKMRIQNLQLFEDSMKAVGLDPKHIETLMGAFYKHLNREQFDAVSLTLADLEFVLNPRSRLELGSANLTRLSFTDLRPQLERISQGIEDMRGVLQGNVRISYEAHVTTANGLHEVYDIPDVGSREVAEQFLKEKLGPDITIRSITEQTITPKAGMERSLKPEVLRGTFLSATQPFVVDIPEAIRPYVTLNVRELEETLRAAGVRDSRVTQLASQIMSHWSEGRNELRFPALGIIAPGRPIYEGGTTVLSGLQTEVMNLLHRLVNYRADAQHPGELAGAVTSYMTRMANLVGRHAVTGEAVTATMSGLRGLAIPSEASPRFLDNPKMLTNKYNALHTTLISRSDAERMNLGEYLTNLYPDNPMYVQEIMEGKRPLMDILEREAHNFTTSAIAVQTYVVSDELHRADRGARRTVRMKTAHVGGPGGVVVSMSRELFKMVNGDSDGDFVSKIFMSAPTREAHDAIQESMRALYTAQTTPYMQNRHFLLVENTIKTGARNAQGQDLYLWRNWVTDPDLPHPDIQYEIIPEHTPEGAAVLRTLRERPQTDPEMGRQHSAFRPGMAVTASEDARIARGLDRWTGRVTIETWNLRTAFDLIEQDTSIAQELKDRLKAARSGSPYPRLQVPHQGGWAYAHEIPVQDAIEKAEIAMADRPFADIMGDVVQIMIAKRSTAKAKEETIANLLVGLSARTSEGVRLRALVGTPELQAILEGSEDLISLLVDKYRTMEGADVARTMASWVTNARDPEALEVLAGLQQIIERHPELPDMPYVAGLLFKPGCQLSRQEREHASQLRAEETMRGLSEPKFFAKRSMRSMVAEALGTESERLRRPGIAIAAAAGLFTLLPVGLFLGGPSQGFGGERYDYWGDGPQLPHDVPLSAPQYTWDPYVSVREPSIPYLAKLAQVNTERLAQSTVQQLSQTWSRPQPGPTTLTYRNHRRTPVTTQRLRREHRSVAQF